MAASEPFPRLLRWALLAPLAVFAAAWMLAMMGAPNNTFAGVFLVATAVAGVVELVAVPVAIFLLARGGPYVSAGNILITLAAGIPLLIVLFVAWLLNFGHFHM